MQSFAKQCSEAKLDKTCPFHVLAQAAIHAYYLTPYSKQEDKRPQDVNRRHHGGVHVSSVAINVDLMIALYLKYAPALLTDLMIDSKLDEKKVKLLKLAAIYHDSANVSEVVGDEKAHADNFRRDMKLLGFTDQEIEPFAIAIQEKDGKLGNAKLPDAKADPKTIFQKILHDADCLDIIRVAGENFRKEFLEIIHDLKSHNGFMQEINHIIQNHHETIQMFSGDSKSVTSDLHKYCEFSENCYLSVYETMKDMLTKQILFELLKKGAIVTLAEINLNRFSILELFNRRNSLVVNTAIESLTKLAIHDEKKSSSSSSLAVKDPVQHLMNNGGCFVRSLRVNELTNELKTLELNATILADHKIQSPDHLKSYINAQKGDTVFTPKGFKWRPCSFIESGLPIKIFSTTDANTITLIIDPNLYKRSITSYFYKRNATSNKASYGLFKYDRPLGYLKNKIDIAGIRNKLREMEARRRGIEYDPHLHYYGNNTLDHSEILGSYQKEGIVGIIVGEGEQAARDALLFRARLNAPLPAFYRYSPTTQMVTLSDSDILRQAHLASQNSPLVDMIKYLNTEVIQSPANALFIVDHDIIERWVDTILLIPVITKSLCCNLNGIDTVTADKLRNYFNQLLLYNPKTVNDITDIISLKVTELDGILTANIEGFAQDEKDLADHDRFILKNVLHRLENYLLNIQTMQSVDDEKLTQCLLSEISPSSLPNIKNLSVGKPISPLNPIKYEFIHTTKANVTCVAWVKEGDPCIEFYLPNKRVLQATTTMLPEIAIQYTQTKIASFNQLLKTPEVSQCLAKLGIHRSQFALVKYAGKHRLTIDLDVADSKNADEQIKNFVKLLTLVNPSKTKITESTTKKQGLREVLITIPDVQYIELIQASLLNRMGIQASLTAEDSKTASITYKK